nr:probable 2-oxoglutarate-dependent dioxygenase AOP1 [Tanacetum cinerariifolium]
PLRGSTQIMCENKAAIHISENPVQHDRTKHVEVDRHFIKEKLEAGIIELPFVKFSDQLADILTKAVGTNMFHKCLSKLNFDNPTIQLEGEWVASHRDKSFMTVIHQEEEGKSLQIQAKDGEWIEVDLSPSTFIVMAGDVCMAWSNGRIQAPYHKVMMQGNKDRYSLVLSSFIRGHKIEVPQELIDEDHPLQFKAFDHYEYIQYVDSNTIQGIRVQDAIKSYCGI